ncbi:6-bladed beta-propeller [Candidatus Palauibacter sp.]|uniref:6-bladed beta-propeller n=1 Tax=Candidatus Palauibacter sp. TaxID=3101350 RepID=UPI003B599F4A
MRIHQRGAWIISFGLLGGVSGHLELEAQSETVRISAEPLIEIGRAEGADEVLFSSIGQALLLEDGRVVVSDRETEEIRVFGPDGGFLNRIGQRGEGPGEFSDVTGLWLTPDGLIGVWDAGNLRIAAFRADGELVGTDRVRVELEPGASVTPEVLLGSFEGGDIVLASPKVGGPPGGAAAIPDRWVLARFGPDGTPCGLLGDLRGMWRLGGQPLPFTPMPHLAVLGDSLFTADGYEARIDVRGANGAVGRTLDLPSVDRSGEADAAWSALETELRARDEEWFLGRLERMPRSDAFPQIGGLLADDVGLLWVKVYDPPADALWLGPALRPGAGGEWRVVRPDGEVLGTVRMPDGVAPLQISLDRLVGIKRDALGVETLVVHSIEGR